MSLAKEKAIEWQMLGFNDVGNKFVCSACIGDKFLKKAIRTHATSKICSYCKRTSKIKNIAAPINNIIAIIQDGIEHEWFNPLNELLSLQPEDSEFGKLFDIWDISDLMRNEAEIENQDLLDDIQRAFIEKQWYKPVDISWEEALSFSWQAFVRLIKRQYRYTFFEIDENRYSEPHDGELKYISPKEILPVLGEIISTYKLINKIPKNTEIYRVRVFKNSDEISILAKDLGTPSHENAIASRMSPAGIPVFYGALDEKTAQDEKKDEIEGTGYPVLAIFKSLINLRILNLAELPATPSMFDKKNRDLRQVIGFLRSFADEISLHIDKDEREHIEYVPTQVISEYFRHVFKFRKNEKIDGIFFKSSKNQVGICCALFVENDACVNSGEELGKAVLQLQRSQQISK